MHTYTYNHAKIYMQSTYQQYLNL